MADSNHTMVSRHEEVRSAPKQIELYALLIHPSWPDKNFNTHRLLLGTHTSGDNPNYLQIANIEIPKNIAPNEKDFDADRGEIGGYGSSAGKESFQMKFKVEQRIRHPGEVNKARYQPQNPNLIATMCPDGRVLVFDRSKHPNEPDSKDYSPQLELKGHTDEGFGLCWSTHEEGKLVSGSNDRTVRLWYVVPKLLPCYLLTFQGYHSTPHQCRLPGLHQSQTYSNFHPPYRSGQRCPIPSSPQGAYWNCIRRSDASSPRSPYEDRK